MSYEWKDYIEQVFKKISPSRGGSKFCSHMEILNYKNNIYRRVCWSKHGSGLWCTYPDQPIDDCPKRSRLSELTKHSNFQNWQAQVQEEYGREQARRAQARANSKPKVSRARIYQAYQEYKNEKKPNRAAKARELGISPSRLQQQFAVLERRLKYGGEKSLQRWISKGKGPASIPESKRLKLDPSVLQSADQDSLYIRMPKKLIEAINLFIEQRKLKSYSDFFSRLAFMWVNCEVGRSYKMRHRTPADRSFCREWFDKINPEQFADSQERASPSTAPQVTARALLSDDKPKDKA